MLKNNYTYKLLERENQRLQRENEQLKNQLQETENLKKEYHALITDLKTCREQYAAALKNIRALETEMRGEMDALITQNRR